MAESKPSLTREKLRELLSVYRICFEAAAEACSFPSVALFRPNPVNERAWDMFLDYNTTRRGDIPADTRAEVAAACKKWSLCDSFCLMLYEVLKGHLQEYGAKFSWVVLDATPTIFLASEGKLPEAFKHSVLLVRTSGGERFIFDCTGEQFDWPGSDWLTTDITKHLQDVMANWGDGAKTLEITRGWVCCTDGGYWKRVMESFEVLFQSVDWGNMAKTDRALVEKCVREEAERRAQAAAVETWG